MSFRVNAQARSTYGATLVQSRAMPDRLPDLSMCTVGMRFDELTDDVIHTIAPDIERPYEAFARNFGEFQLEGLPNDFKGTPWTQIVPTSLLPYAKTSLTTFILSNACERLLDIPEEIVPPLNNTQSRHLFALMAFLESLAPVAGAADEMAVRASKPSELRGTGAARALLMLLAERVQGGQKRLYLVHRANITSQNLSPYPGNAPPPRSYALGLPKEGTNEVEVDGSWVQLGTEYCYQAVDGSTPEEIRFEPLASRRRADKVGQYVQEMDELVHRSDEGSAGPLRSSAFAAALAHAAAHVDHPYAEYRLARRARAAANPEAPGASNSQVHAAAAMPL